jgi:predicted RecA/RadA family phage recombinase
VTSTAVVMAQNGRRSYWDSVIVRVTAAGSSITTKVRLQTDPAPSSNKAGVTAASQEAAVYSYLAAMPQSP